MTDFSEKEAYEFFERYYTRVKAFIQSMVRQDFLAEDLTQEAFIRAYRHLPTLKDQRSAKAWLFRIAKNCCMDYFRKSNGDGSKDRPSIDLSLLPSCSQQEHAVEQQEMAACVQNHIQLLPENLRTVLWLFDAEGFTHKEIAHVLDIEVTNVKVRLHRARQKMKQILSENCRFERDERNVFVCVPSRDPES